MNGMHKGRKGILKTIRHGGITIKAINYCKSSVFVIFSSWISLEEVDNIEFLFVTQIPYDVGGLGGICADLDDLHGDVLIVRGLHTGC
jgi:hypothetical protein